MKKLLAIVALAVTAAVFAQSYVDNDQRVRTQDGSIVQVIRQPATLRNSSATGAANTAVTRSIAALTGQSVRLLSLEAYCSAGTATVTVKDGVAGSTVWVTPAAASTARTFFTPLASTAGNGMDVVLAACGTSNTGTLNVQASQF